MWVKRPLAKLLWIGCFLLACCPVCVSASEEYASNLWMSDLKTVGKQEENGQTLFVFNQSGKKIKKIQMKKPGKEEWSGNVLQKSEVIENEEKVQLCLPEKFSECKCDIRLTFGKEETKILHGLKLQDTVSIRVYQAEKYAYVDYVSMEEKDIISTEKTERKIWEEEERKRREEEERRRREEEERQRALAEAAARAAAAKRAASSRSSGRSSSSRRSEGCADSGGGRYKSDGHGGWVWVSN
ncbi:MAG: hypothetical protein Q4D60_05315 [Eubacteriales bacterium]|nr:hypothetical protein [Eubacteriales bacterium]